MYSCECGRTFEKVTSYHGHRSNCQIWRTAAEEEEEEEEEEDEGEEEGSEGKIHMIFVMPVILEVAICDTCTLAGIPGVPNYGVEGDFSCPVCIASDDESDVEDIANDERDIKRQKVSQSSNQVEK